MHCLNSSMNSEKVQVSVGVVLDLNSSVGSMVKMCMDMAISDFYSSHSDYHTRLQLHNKDAKTALDVYFAAVDLLEHEQVEVMMGPEGSTQDIFVSELGQKSHVPIISFSARSLALPTTQNNFYVRTAVDDSNQARALAAICKAYQWSQVVLLYEDTEYGHQFQSHLSNAFRDVEIGLVHLTPIPLSANDKTLSKQLSSLSEQETRVFLLHMTPSLGFRLFNVAKNVGLMRDGSAWIITDSLSNFFSLMDSATRDSMEGVLAVRPYVPSSQDLKDFRKKWERNSSRASMDLNVYGFWAYDTIKALAIATENVGASTLRSCKNNIVRDAKLRISSCGPRLVSELSRTRFRGLSGYFEITDSSMKAPDFEIVNLIGTGERRVGFWNPERGITRDQLSYSGESKDLKSVLWPGDSRIIPEGIATPPTGILRVGVPWKPGFKQFVDAEVINPTTKEATATGFAVDIFLYAMKKMPFPPNYKFYCYNDSTTSHWSYDSMLREIPQKYDMVVADTTIWGPRALYVDFSLPYSESRVVLVVRNNKPFNMWIFTKPLSWDLWVAILAACVFMGFVIWRLEHRASRGHEDDDDDRLKIAFLVPIAALAFQERALVETRASVMVLVCWLFTAFVLMQSYTANLSAILTLDQLKFSFSEDQYYGYHVGSFTKKLLTEKLQISPTRLRPYASVEEFHDAMCIGSKNGGVDGIFDELPYMKILLNRYDSQYKIIGQYSYRTNGLGFAFPIGSPLVSRFSRAILNVTQGPEMISLEQQYFGTGYSQDPPLNTVSQGASSLALRDFAGLFIIAAAITIFAWIAAETDFFTIFTKNLPQFINRHRTYRKGDEPVDGGNDAPAAAVDGANDEPDAAAGGGGDVNGDGGNAEIEVAEIEHNGGDGGADVNEARRELT